MGNSVAYAGLLLVELILLVIKFIYTTVESIIRTFLPPLEKSLKDEIILVSSLVNTICYNIRYDKNIRSNKCCN